MQVHGDFTAIKSRIVAANSIMLEIFVRKIAAISDQIAYYPHTPQLKNATLFTFRVSFLDYVDISSEKKKGKSRSGYQSKEKISFLIK
jgi:hypothetical protein